MTTKQARNDLVRAAGYVWPREWAEFVNSLWSGDEWSRRTLGGFDGTMRVEETIDDGTLLVRAELPGVDPDKDVEISIDDGVLSISARRESKTKEGEKTSYRTEFRYGSFLRQIQLPKNADLDSISASYADGVLEVKIPLPPENLASARKIAISRS